MPPRERMRQINGKLDGWKTIGFAVVLLGFIIVAWVNGSMETDRAWLYLMEIAILLGLRDSIRRVHRDVKNGHNWKGGSDAGFK